MNFLLGLPCRYAALDSLEQPRTQGSLSYDDKNRIPGKKHARSDFHTYNGPLSVTSGGPQDPSQRARGNDIVMAKIAHAGCLSRKTIKSSAERMSLTFVVLAANILLGNLTDLCIQDEALHTANGINDKDSFPSHIVTNSRYMKHLEQLHKQFQLLEDLGSGDALLGKKFCCTKFFPVLKKSGEGRAIMDSREAGAACTRPRQVCLPPYDTVIKAGAKSKFFWTADFMH